MTKDLGIGLLAGLVSALLFGVLLKATPLAIVLYLLAPLPILIAGLGWSHRAALAAVVSGSLALAIGASAYLGIAFALYLALPAWWLAYLALLGRPNADGSLEWYPTGRLLAWIAATAALAFVAIAVVASPNYETFRTQLSAMTKRVVQAQMQGRAVPPPGKPAEPGSAPPAQNAPATEPAPDQTTKDQPQKDDPNKDLPNKDLQSEVADALVAVAPALAAQGLAILLAFYLWLAGRIVQVSGRLLRPWPDIPSTAMPRQVLLVFAGAFGLTLIPGYPGVLGVALIGSFCAAFALQGLAAFHDRSRGRPGRMALLIGLYVFLFVTQGLALFALTLFGIADTALGRRAKPAAR